MAATTKRKDHTSLTSAAARQTISRLTELNRILPEYRDVWGLLYQRLEEGADPGDVYHLANRYTLGVCLRAALMEKEDSDEV